MLAVRKEGTEEFIITGGGHEPGETHLDTLQREFREEIQCDIVGWKDGQQPLVKVLHKAIWTDEPLLAHVYLIDIEGEPVPSSEIVEVVWLDINYKERGYKLGSILEEEVIPRLIEMGLL